jgi:hypothetical protein
MAVLLLALVRDSADIHAAGVLLADFARKTPSSFADGAAGNRFLCAAGFWAAIGRLLHGAAPHYKTKISADESLALANEALRLTPAHDQRESERCEQMLEARRAEQRRRAAAGQVS